jgi:hypothetical protein
MAWGFLKSFYNKHIPFCAETKGGRVKQMWQKTIDHFTPEMWHNSVCHCEDIIREDWRKLMGNAPIEDIPPIIIRLGEDSDSEEETGDSDTDSSSANEKFLIVVFFYLRSYVLFYMVLSFNCVLFS